MISQSTAMLGKNGLIGLTSTVSGPTRKAQMLCLQSTMLLIQTMLFPDFLGAIKSVHTISGCPVGYIDTELKR